MRRDRLQCCLAFPNRVAPLKTMCVYIYGYFCEDPRFYIFAVWASLACMDIIVDCHKFTQYVRTNLRVKLGLGLFSWLILD